ncbi:MAG: IPT/TIG domain-containing protein [Planctomycetota bacterium]|jgi:hypothetical protein
MNNFRTRTMLRSVAVAVLFGLTACSSGGGGSAPTFKLFSVDPNESLDLNGGDKVIIHGENFLAARVARVTFGEGNPGFFMSVLDDTRIEITVPPSPQNRAQIVTVEVETLELGTKGIFGGYTYIQGGGPTGPPQPQTIFPTNFTPTGAESFTIQGTDLGTSGGTVLVHFQGIGTVVGNVNATGNIVTGRAPVSPNVPPSAAFTVTVENSGLIGDVPTQVNYIHAAPLALSIPNQESGDNVSRPARISDSLAVVASSGPDLLWGNGNEDLVLLMGPPNTIQAKSLLGAQPAANRYIHRDNSIVVALNSDTICLLSPGPAVGAEFILLITNLQAATPTVRAIPAPNAAPIPLGRVSAQRIAFVLRGTGAGGQDQLQVYSIVNGLFTGSLPTPINIGTADPNGIAGRGNLSIPFSPDGDAVFVYTTGANGAFNDFDDLLFRYSVSTQQIATTPARYLRTKPIALAGDRVVGIAGPLASPPSPNDHLAVFTVASNAFSVSHIDLGAVADVGAPRPLAPLGDGNVALIAGGPDRAANTPDDVVAVFTDDGNGSFNRVDASLGRRPVLTPLADGDMVVFGRGTDALPGTPDDRAIRVLADGSSLQDFTGAPFWPQVVAPLGDGTRAFAIGLGTDGIAATGDEELLVYQTVTLGNGADNSTLPMSVNIASRVASTLTTPIVFVPIGSSWGAVQSPGFDGFWATGDDQVLIVRY